MLPSKKPMSCSSHCPQPTTLPDRNFLLSLSPCQSTHHKSSTHRNLKRVLSFDSPKHSAAPAPVPILRSKQKKRWRARTKLKDNLQNIKHQIEKNHNIFTDEEVLETVPCMELQNILWDRNYRLKSQINRMREDNNALRARTWNLQKDSRKMKKQIEFWNLAKSTVFSGQRQPYIDPTTMQKVFRDQDFNVVSMKIEIAELNKVLEEKEKLIKQTNHRIENFEENADSMNDEMRELGKEVFRYINTEKSDISINKLRKQVKENIHKNQAKIRTLEKQLANKMQNKQELNEQLSSIDTPPATTQKRRSKMYTQIRRSSYVSQDSKEEEQRSLKIQIAEKTQKVEELQLKAQQLISDSVIYKQKMNKRISQLLKKLSSLKV